ncbi:1-phosphofructokinase family hexose kinase [Erythrobacter insulae]|uniref:Phosphofructokinase n=1 Tax=Erythrobacter insulae TaxID=2584124 RepID=A0A547PBV9_9SPHN|nr:1-phosphofructokinase family hexose kinase [Erythrobacter insulae]TRD11622.1 1-phosphofructokinase family hexose kinase [Erythrobacter insulae]
MMNIATLTLNPTIDVAYSLDRFVHSDKLRTAEQKADPGGGGINVARVFVRLGGNARCVYMSGGSTGAALDALLDLHQIVREPVSIEGETRISATMFEQSSGHEYRIVPAGPVISEAEWHTCLDRLSSVECDYLVISGSLPRGIPADFYAQVASDAKQRGVRTVLDSSGDALKAAVAAGKLEMVKPNLKEFQQLIGEDISDPILIGKAAQDIARSGSARLIVVSLGERGGILASAEHVIECAAPKVASVSSVGAGDSCVAAMVHCLAAGKSNEEAFRYGMAAGGAALLTPGTDLARPADIRRLFEQYVSET